MRTLELNEIAYVSGGLVGAESGSLLCDAAATRPPGTNAWGEVPTLFDHLSSAWGAITASTVETLKTNAQFFLDNGLISWMLGTSSGVGIDGQRTDGAELGYGCGTASTDRIVPDTIFGVSVAPACKTHDDEYKACISKDTADLNFKNSIYNSLVTKGIDSVRASIVSQTYYLGVQSSIGQAAYNESCPQSKP